MKRIGAALAAIAVAALGTLAVASPASADHNTVIVDLTVDKCTLTGTTSWTIPDGPNDHQVANTELVVLAGGTVHHAVVGTPLNVDLPAGTTEFQWRVWGGGERNYDDPALSDLSALLAYLGGGGSPFDANAPGVAWYTEDVADCPRPQTQTTTATTTTSKAPTLPVTGASLGGLIALAVALIGGGIALLVLRRRRGAEG